LPSFIGNYQNLDLHTRYFQNAKEVLDVISPGHDKHFNDCLTARLKQLEKEEEAQDDRQKQQQEDEGKENNNGNASAPQPNQSKQ
jgi:hypothetical protein